MKRTKAKTLFIVNPNAGQQKIQKLLFQLENLDPPVAVQITKYPKHAAQIVGEQFDNFDVFVAVGGDGTVNEMASALVGSTKKLAVLPFGSGNGFAREFGFSRNLPHLMSAIEHGKTMSSDVMLVNGYVSMHISGVGYDGSVAHDFHKLKGRGFRNYLISTMRVIWRFVPIEASIELENETINGRFFMVNLANTAQFGYGAQIAPQANPTDGRFDLVMVRAFPISLFPLFSLKLFLGRLKPSKHVQYLPCKNALIMRTSSDKFHIDGEPILIENPVKIELSPYKVLVVDTGKAKFMRH
ncbi:YegS/Rv2252/BmrU family lipid kinase [uncultured Sunxiuqinia sp.]|uniref:diacylglycerol/lipid kinase family protein n=1 Tax=uncultured Sunxiuqinia sp. TaxID=1573825 RepID=UPI0030D81907|tara:strand:- start:2478 stop:3371 length:894 start_codon:yes stop_codon:yes gene_type:complete